MAEIIITPAPHHDDYHGHGDGHGHGREVEHLHQFEHIARQHDHRQGGNPQNRPVLAVHLPIRAHMDGPGQSEYAQPIGNDDAGEHKKRVQRAVGDADIVEPVRGRQPSDLSVEKAVPVKEHRGQHKEIGNGQNP